MEYFDHIARHMSFTRNPRLKFLPWGNMQTLALWAYEITFLFINVGGGQGREESVPIFENGNEGEGKAMIIVRMIAS